MMYDWFSNRAVIGAAFAPFLDDGMGQSKRILQYKA